MKNPKCSFCKCSDNNEIILWMSRKTTSKICHKCILHLAVRSLDHDMVREEWLKSVEDSISKRQEIKREDISPKHQDRLSRILKITSKELDELKMIDQ